MRWSKVSLWKQASFKMRSFTVKTKLRWYRIFQPQQLVIDTSTGKKLKKQLLELLENEQQTWMPSLYSSEEMELIQSIQHETMQNNRNNVTRTNAYLKLYQQMPELHWAFLAHMVSRNGGWNMTDLKGEWLPRLLSTARIQYLFEFLERANSFIFHDAYPQLALYREAKKRNTPLTHLLPAFGVSRFMRPVWEHFWKERNSALLTLALIINEQNYIEKRVVQNPYFKQKVIHTLSFQFQSLLQLNQVIFPYSSPGENANKNRNLAGLILEDFADLNERIEFGKSLYAILFSHPEILEGARRFAKQRPHTGSREDYWPELFRSIHIQSDAPVYHSKLNGCHLKKEDQPIYSPSLQHVWKDQQLHVPKSGDWFTNKKAIAYLENMPSPNHFNIEKEHCFALQKIEAAVLAGEWFDQL